MNKFSVMACITCQQSSVNIIKTAYSFSSGWEAKLYVLCVMPNGALSTQDAEMLDELRLTANELGAEFCVLFDNCPAFAAVGFAKRRHISYVFTGEPADINKGFVPMLSAVLPKVRITVFHRNGDLTNLNTNIHVKASTIAPLIS